MKELMTMNQKQTMSSLDFRIMINESRVSANESIVENSHFLKRIEDELEGELGTRKLYQNPEGGRPTAYYELTMPQAIQILTRENKAARRMLSESITDHMDLLKAYQNMDVTELEPDKYVYVIKNLTTGAYKVGIGKNPKQRLKSLQVGNDGELILIDYKHGTFQDETAAHKRLVDKNIRAEWFNLDSKDIQTLIN